MILQLEDFVAYLKKKHFIHPALPGSRDSEVQHPWLSGPVDPLFDNNIRQKFCPK